MISRSVNHAVDLNIAKVFVDYVIGYRVNRIQIWVAKFRAAGSILRRPRPGPTPTGATAENIKSVLVSLTERPLLSLRERSSILEITKSTLQVRM